jgi:hypothetical protein
MTILSPSALGVLGSYGQRHISNASIQGIWGFYF